jgi:hypothetical protein
MIDLFLNGKQIETVFDLLGDKENDITFSVGWALSRCDEFLSELLKQMLPPGHGPGASHSVRLQEYAVSGGYTDIEIITERAHVIVEAKRGWNLPHPDQLQKYARRLSGGASGQAIAVMAECTPEYASLHLPNSILDIPVRYLSWKQVAGIARGSRSRGSQSDRRLLRELSTYLGRLVQIQNQDSNLVFVVALSNDVPGWATISWREIVTKRGMYFHPMGKSGWPKEPPNYIGFRYYGKLQSIHHLEDYRVITNVTEMSTYIPEIDGSAWRASEPGAYMLYTLGPAIIPPGTVKMGAIYPSGRVWAMLDLLLTCDTISDARDLTKKRLQPAADSLV